MLITENFVVLNFPKTGSSFVRNVVKSLYQRRIDKRPLGKMLSALKIINPGYVELFPPNPAHAGNKDQHAAYSQIPTQFKHRPIVSAIRSPYQRFESLYRYKWWAKYPGLDLQILRRNFPQFPDLSIDDFVLFRELTTRQLKMKYGIPDDIVIGDQTIKFINMFFTNPQKVLSQLDTLYMSSDSHIRDIANVEFLRQENLNNELADFLARSGFTDAEVEFARAHRKINVTNLENRRTDKLLTKDTLDYIETSEWFLLKILSAKGIEYSRPQ